MKNAEWMRLLWREYKYRMKECSFAILDNQTFYFNVCICRTLIAGFPTSTLLPHYCPQYWLVLDHYGENYRLPFFRNKLNLNAIAALYVVNDVLYTAK